MQATHPIDLSNPINPATDSRLGEFASHLAKIHTVATSRSPKVDLLKYLVIWERVLHTANAIFKSVPSNDLPVSRAGEWMLDNFYLVKQTFRQIEEDLPASFLNHSPYADLSKLGV
jgi:hypothetical protein